ncbi:predicted protein [Sclerotinia sclerotiorum 1980 UF-70]|uniref:Uncharacterized protein n=1 Tax=Sclerotinia sclerotiorum (strain ATCC 18683 / 1980 / Ss-1) TaxID=665079 RepID=A7EJL5_SCLS1|nr:predicted protein [Sclerotinia sclerotiorum 1980 UF-70]EDO03031.1 predicted protein [Sclerotinia sclerotiorum 1980 UF-70]
MSFLHLKKVYSVTGKLILLRFLPVYVRWAPRSLRMLQLGSQIGLSALPSREINGNSPWAIASEPFSIFSEVKLTATPLKIARYSRVNTAYVGGYLRCGLSSLRHDGLCYASYGQYPMVCDGTVARLSRRILDGKW